MIESFEIWLKGNKKNLSVDVAGLFEDSLKCYHNDIIRPAYLLAYQGMILTLRNALCCGIKPTGFEDAEWQNKISKLNLDSKGWEEATFALVKQTETGGTGNDKSAPLCMSSHIRCQFDFWRIQRNACAHYKSDSLIKAHVIALYHFIEQWLLRISVVGGTEEMLDIMRDYCDASKTSPNTPIENVLKWINTLVRYEDNSKFEKNP